MNDFGLLFPGQGSQTVGMAADLYERFPACRDVYDRAEQVLELPVKRLSFEGPEGELRQTRYTQPAILTHSLAVLACLPELRPPLAAGHSLGEYSALYAAGVFGFETVMKLVKRRAALMFAEGERNPGAMAAVIGMDSAGVEALCREVPGTVVPANYNEPKQTVVSGEVEAVKAAAELARARGALKAMMLPVSGAFHSPLLRESAREFAEFLSGFELRPPAFPVIMNATGAAALDAAAVRENLSRQLVSPVRWLQTMLTAKATGCAAFLEVGPGNVLAGLARRIDREVRVNPLGRTAEIEALLAGQEGD
ncbi:ACP S-malonyltransferase [candidate division WOR-3 bacterium]|nr:ACP S-malonyltransferase [candidate division WOR-3 bacterium]